MHSSDLLVLLDRIAPLKYAESWDNVGLLVGQPNDEVRRVLITIDLTEAVLDEAQAMAADLIIAYHPVWLKPLRSLAQQTMVLRAVRAGFSLYSPHTAFDAAIGGVNDVLADAAGICPEARRPLVASAAHQEVGMGRVGPTAVPQNFDAWLRALKRAMGVDHALLAQPRGGGRLQGPEATRQVCRVAVCAGAGDAMWQDAVMHQVDTFVVGELRHHHALSCVAKNVRIVALLHSNSERAALAIYAAKLAQMAPELTVRVSTTDMDPYSFC